MSETVLMTAAANLVSQCCQTGKTLTVAESCTGGLVASAITSISGASAMFDRGFVTYTNEAKSDMLGVPAETIISVGAVSEQVAKSMAAGAIRHSKADIAISITGVAGPGGGTPTKPVGTVWIGICERGGNPTAYHHIFPGDRTAVRLAATCEAIRLFTDNL